MENECIVDDCFKPIRNKMRQLCETHYTRFLTGKDPHEKKKIRPPGMSNNDALEWFGWIETDTGCWEWAGNRDRLGYGRLKLRNQGQKAYRVAYEAWVGAIPAGMAILHKCDNPPCINPEHLQLGTQAENVYDMHRKGRDNSAKYSDDYVKAAREVYKTGKLTQKEVEKAFGLSSGFISRLMNGKTRPKLYEGNAE